MLGMRYWHGLKSVESHAIYTIEVEFNLAWSKWLNSFGGLFQTYHAISPLACDPPSICLMGIYILWSRLIVSDYPMGCFWHTTMPPMVSGFLINKFVILSKWFMTHCIFHYLSPLWLFYQPCLLSLTDLCLSDQCCMWFLSLPLAYHIKEALLSRSV